MATAAVLRPHDCLIGPKTGRLSRNPNPNSTVRRRKFSPTKSPAKPLFSGHVTILKRGEVFPSPATSAAEQYAGAAMVVASPPPSSVPFPAFCRRSENSVAASDIRRMLGMV